MRFFEAIRIIGVLYFLMKVDPNILKKISKNTLYGSPATIIIGLIVCMYWYQIF